MSTRLIPKQRPQKSISIQLARSIARRSVELPASESARAVAAGTRTSTADQRGSLQAHEPEVCYPAQGFVLRKNEAGQLVTTFGEIPVRRLFTTLGPRQEPVTYWFTVGDKAVRGTTQKRLVDLRYGLTGRIPEGMLFRVSSIYPDHCGGSSWPFWKNDGGVPAPVSSKPCLIDTAFAT